MEKVHTAQVAKTLVLFFLLFMIPFVSSPMRTSYLYFILNLLILVLAIESGILTAAPADSKDEKKQAAHSHALSSQSQNLTAPPNASTTKNNQALATAKNIGFSILDKKPMSASDKKPVASRAAATQRKIKKSHSRPSLFFIGGFEDREEEEASAVTTTKDGGFRREVAAEEEKEEEEIFHDDLFARAETFIGNFYSQLKIQREESWKKIHGFYHKPL